MLKSAEEEEIGGRRRGEEEEQVVVGVEWDACLFPVWGASEISGGRWYFYPQRVRVRVARGLVPS
jgi:hypothetical protein